MDENDKLNILKEILLTDEREYAYNISKKIEILEKTLNERKLLSQKVDPIVDGKIDSFVENIPKTLGPTITETLKQEIKNSKDQVVEALYPIMGKMIKKYIQQEINLLSDKINQQVENSFSAKSWKRRFTSWFTGVKEEDIIISELNKAEVLQVLIIDKNSGLLIGSYEKVATIDKDMISGMLTAIKHFIEDAFQNKDQSLELIEYELYNIHIQNFISYYIAVAISGNYTTEFKNKLQDIIFDFSQNYLKLFPDPSKIEEDVLVKELSHYFNDENI
ncbi:cell envelope biogenesis protein OmpA [Abyssalbus ytuae]|uniref:Cell envelope biogenesis protein OmpA n=1 Tax=Abyssalbus ytuae TaxID=2926907 RepID=A0A9E6ZQR1_9FLAO|nr:cell envelope biogenesis protein OmpA [Abyssalbus ytuae]UOB16168.1 cell envelope biogenesis protein OmpA [Abyssalbus ytuae]